jgi:NADP-dependent 3-hydroxy acid dehydrogenase YdfG
MSVLQGAVLAGRVVAVTGASRGIGEATARLLAQAGAKVIAGARQRVAWSEPAITDMVLDVTDEASVRLFAAAAIEAGVDSLVNNAGVGAFGPIDEASVDDYRRLMDTNVLGTLLMTKWLIPEFKRRHQRGLQSHLVNVTSDVSARTFANGGLYTASKHAQRALTQTIAHEGQGYGLRVTEVRPGMTDTHFNANTPGRPERARHLRPEDVASAVLYALAAPAHVRVDEITLHPTEQSVVF